MRLSGALRILVASGLGLPSLSNALMNVSPIPREVCIPWYRNNRFQDSFA